MPKEPRTGWYLMDLGEGRVAVEGPLQKNGFWYVSALFALHRGQLVMAELRVFPGSGLQDVKRSRGRVIARKPEIGEWSREPADLEGMPTKGISKRLLETVSFSKLFDEARARIRDAFAADPDLGRVEELQEATKRRRRPDDDYLVWAERYDALMSKAGGTRSPIVDLAKKHRRTPASVRDLVNEARSRGLLSRGHGPQARGFLTGKARDVRKRLDEQERKRRGSRHGAR